MLGRVEGADLPKTVFLYARRERRRRRMAWMVAAPLLALMLGGALVPVLAGLARHVRTRAEITALSRLPYPPMPADGEVRLKRTRNEFWGLYLTQTPALRVESAQAKLVLRAFTEEQAGERRAPSRDVTLDLATMEGALLPVAEFRTSPLVLELAGEKIAIYSTELEAELSATQRARGETSALSFRVPTAVFLSWLREGTPRAALGGLAFEVPEDSRRTLVALAASMRPRGR
jgi:hypothetical protein